MAWTALAGVAAVVALSLAGPALVEQASPWRDARGNFERHVVLSPSAIHAGLLAGGPVTLPTLEEDVTFDVVVADREAFPVKEVDAEGRETASYLHETTLWHLSSTTDPTITGTMGSWDHVLWGHVQTRHGPSDIEPLRDHGAPGEPVVEYKVTRMGDNRPLPGDYDGPAI